MRLVGDWYTSRHTRTCPRPCACPPSPASTPRGCRSRAGPCMRSHPLCSPLLEYKDFFEFLAITKFWVPIRKTFFTIFPRCFSFSNLTSGPPESPWWYDESNYPDVSIYAVQCSYYQNSYAKKVTLNCLPWKQGLNSDVGADIVCRARPSVSTQRAEEPPYNTNKF